RTLLISTSRRGECNDSIFKELISNRDSETVYTEKNSLELFDGEQNFIRVSDIENPVTELIERKAYFRLEDNFNVNQGVVSGCDYISNRNIDKLNTKTVQLKDGIFVLDLDNERDSKVVKSLQKKDKELLRPFFKNSDISQF